MREGRKKGNFSQ